MVEVCATPRDEWKRGEPQVLTSSAKELALKVLLLLSLVMPLFGCGAESQAPAPSPVEGVPTPSEPQSHPAPDPNLTTVVFLGDSLAAGYNLPAEEAFPALLKRRLGAAETA